MENENEMCVTVCEWVCVCECIRDDQLFNLIIFDDIWTEIHKYSFKRDHYLWLNAADQTNQHSITYAISCIQTIVEKSLYMVFGLSVRQSNIEVCYIFSRRQITSQQMEKTRSKCVFFPNIHIKKHKHTHNTLKCLH